MAITKHPVGSPSGRDTTQVTADDSLTCSTSGKSDQADQAEQELPDQVDIDRDVSPAHPRFGYVAPTAIT
jgi:hypothetical protein